MKLVSKILTFAVVTGSTYFSDAKACGRGLSMNSPSTVNMSAGAVTTQFTISRNSGNGGTGTCSFFIVIDYGGASSFSQRELERSGPDYPIQFYKDSGRTQIVKSINDATSTNDIIVGQFATSGTGTVTINMFAYLDTSLFLPSGTYQNEFKVRLYQGTLSSRTLQDEDDVLFRYTKSVMTDISLVNTGAAFNVADTTQTLDFGELTTNEVGQFDILLRYNAGYELFMRSDNSSRLRNPVTNTYISYTLRLNGNVISPLNTTPRRVADEDEEEFSSSNGDRLPVSVTIGNVAGAQAGTYSDTVSITVQSAD